MYIDVKTIQKVKYQEFVNHCLKKAHYIFVSMINDDVPILFGEMVSLPKKINYHTIVLSENEQVYCYINKYYEASSVFSQYNSMKEFLDFNNIYRLMFVNENEVVVECMQDGIITY